MKKTKLKFIFILLISLITIIPINNIKAITLEEETTGGVTRKKVVGKYSMGGYSASVPHLRDDLDTTSSGIVSTHAMSVTIEGEKDPIPAYCAWYENDSPLATTGNTTYLSLTDKEFPQKYAVGLAKIIYSEKFDGICEAVYDNKKLGDKEYVDYYAWNNKNHKLNGQDCIRAMKTTALNLYLSLNNVVAGKKCDSDGERFDGAMGYTDLEIFSNNGIEDSAGMYDAYKNRNNIFWKKIAEVVDDAEAAEDAYKNNPAKLTVKETNAGEDYKLIDGYYQKSFDITSNYTIKNGVYNGKTIPFTGTITTSTKTEECGIYDKTNPSNSSSESCYINTIHSGQYVVFVKKDVYEKATAENASGLKIVIKAKVDKEKIYVFTNKNQSRCKYQDLIFVLPEPELVEVLTDVPPGDSQICWKYITTCNATACTNKKTNTRECSSNTKSYPAEECDQGDKYNTEYGTLTYRYKSCNLYCKEIAKVNYPGNLLDPVSLNGNTNFVWPTPVAQNEYSLTTSGTLECHAVPKNSIISLETCVNEIKNDNKRFEYKNNATGSVIYNNLAKKVSVKVKGTCNTTQTGINENGKITIENNCAYSLENEYNAFDSETLKAIKVERDDYISQNDNKIVLSTQPFLPLVDDKSKFPELSRAISDKYLLQISDLTLGHKGQFTDELKKNEYVCNYKVTDEISICTGSTGSCVCPPGTDHAGKKLTSILMNENLTCSDAIEKYCNKCEDGTCDACAHDSCICYKINTGAEVDITACLDEGYGFSACALDNDCVQYNLVCPPETDLAGKSLECCIKEHDYDYCVSEVCYAHCPSNSKTPDANILNCMNGEIAKGKDANEAYDICIEKCYYDCPPPGCPPDDPDDPDGKIIYRTISLEKPFVGKMGTSQTTRESLYNISDFNTKGGALAIYRLPGNNWNSPIVVNNKIWNNRGYKASEIYNEAKPLYTINLDPTSIKKIREYNENNKYDDFKLTCTSGAYCISEFVHDTLKNMKNADNSSVLSQTESTCYNASNKSTFESCYETKKVGNN